MLILFLPVVLAQIHFNLELDIVTEYVEAPLLCGSLVQFVHFLLYSLYGPLPSIHRSFNVDTAVYNSKASLLLSVSWLSGVCYFIEMLMRRKTAPVRKSRTSKRKSRKQHQLVM